MKVWIDQDLCTGDGLCEEIAPSVFTLLDDGLAYARSVPASLLELRPPAWRRIGLALKTFLPRHPKGRLRRGSGRRSCASLCRTGLAPPYAWPRHLPESASLALGTLSTAMSSL